MMNCDSSHSTGVAPCILIVDDDPQFRKALHLALGSCGYQVTDAIDGEGALASVASSTPDVVVLDWQLPGIDGIQTCREIRARADVPVIIVSANRPMSHTMVWEAGAVGYLTKPFSMNELVTHIESALKN
ncbi:MAG: response regulator transcription factor [Bryobacteraceae bacterium]